MESSPPTSSPTLARSQSGKETVYRFPLQDIRRIWCHHNHCYEYIRNFWIIRFIFQEGPAGGDDVGVVQMEEEEEEEEEREEREDEGPVGENGGGEGQQEEVREQADQAE